MCVCVCVLGCGLCVLRGGVLGGEHSVWFRRVCVRECVRVSVRVCIGVDVLSLRVHSAQVVAGGEPQGQLQAQLALAERNKDLQGQALNTIAASSTSESSAASGTATVLPIPSTEPSPLTRHHQRPW